MPRTGLNTEVCSYLSFSLLDCDPSFKWFRSPPFKKKSIEKHINSSSTVPKDGLNSPPLKRKSPITEATSSEMDIFFENLMKSDKKPAILRILPGYAEKFRPKSLDTPCKSLKNLYSDSCLNMSFQYLPKNAMKFLNPFQFPRTRHWILKVKREVRVRAKNGVNKFIYTIFIIN